MPAAVPFIPFVDCCRHSFKKGGYMSIRVKNRLIEIGCFLSLALIPAAVFAGDLHGQYLAPIIENML